MIYPEFCKNVVDITKAPYFADNTGKTDCTSALKQAIDDCLHDYIAAIEQTHHKLQEMYEKQGSNVYIGSETGRVVNGEVLITYPEEVPPAKIIFFPSGIYLVSDTVTYTFDNLSTRQQINYTCELCRNIHILGESKESTVIRLQDNAKGFEKGCHKPVISFNKASNEDITTTNCAQMNTLEDISIDCGNGNEGAIGVLYASSNCGRIENVNIKSQTGFCGIEYDYESEGCMTNIKISGFDYGIKTTHTSPLIFDNIDLSGNHIAGVITKNGNLNFKNVIWGDIPAFSFMPGQNGRYYFEYKNIKYKGDLTGNYIFSTPDIPLVECMTMPEIHRSKNFETWACVDDFGAIGDGKTDSTIAIQRAMDSGKEVIIFGMGNYVIERTVKIPETVKIIDLMYCNIIPGYSLVIGEMDSVFDICKNSKNPLLIEQFCSDERFSGFFRFCKQTSQRTVILKDLFSFAPLYFNTEGGSEVYFDNCFTLTTHYAQDVLHRDGYTPVFCKMIPVELHGQKAYAKNLNIERAEIELLNDNSVLLIDGYKTEGPGKMVKTVNNAKTQLNLFNSAWWGNKLPENEMFDISESSMMLIGGNIFCYPDKDELRMAFRVKHNGKESRTNLIECSTELVGKDALNRSWGRLIENISIT